MNELPTVRSARERMAVPGHTGAVRATTGTPRVWSVPDGKELFRLTGHKDYANGLAYSPDVSVLATGSEDRSVRLWDARTGTPIRSRAGRARAVWPVVFSPDGRSLATGGWDDTVRVWGVPEDRPTAG